MCISLDPAVLGLIKDAGKDLIIRVSIKALSIKTEIWKPKYTVMRKWLNEHQDTQNWNSVIENIKMRSYKCIY